MADAVDLGHDVYWFCHPGGASEALDEQWVETAVLRVLRGGRAEDVITAIKDFTASELTEVSGLGRAQSPWFTIDAPGSITEVDVGPQMEGSARTRKLKYPNQKSVPVRIIRPETCASLGNCRWDGDGHFQVAKLPSTRRFSKEHTGQGKRSAPTLGQVVAFVRMVESSSSAEAGTAIAHLTSEACRASGAVLAGSVLVLLRGMSAAAAWATVSKISTGKSTEWCRFPSPVAEHQYELSSTSCTVLDCLSGLEAAKRFGWLDHRTFDLKAWELLRRKFDATWLIPGEVLAVADPDLTAQNPKFPGLLVSSRCSTPTASPVKLASKKCMFGTLSSSCVSEMTGSTAATETPSDDGYEGEAALLTKESFQEFFDRHFISSFVRLSYANEETREINEKSFSDNLRVMHHEFLDGTVPNKAVAHSFLADCQKVSPVAVHCKAGLGRTGVMVGLYAVTNYDIDGRAFLGWARICRPGSVQTMKQEAYLCRLTRNAIPRSSSCMACFG